MREVILDTETTGLSPDEGHKIIEIACLEVINKKKTGNYYHVYINPKRHVSERAFEVHGISTAFLHDKKTFSEIVDDFLDFIKDSPLIIHNAKFDLKFLNAELKSINKPLLDEANVIDTLIFARNKYPGSPASLDALCKKFKIEILAKRDKHGALIDTELLFEVYLRLIESETTLLNLAKINLQNISDQGNIQNANKEVKKSRNFTLSDLELDMHKSLLKKIKNPVWES